MCCRPNVVFIFTDGPGAGCLPLRYPASAGRPWTCRIADPDKGPAANALGRSIVTEPTQSPRRRTVTGSADAGGHVAAGVVMVIATRETGLTAADLLADPIIVRVTAKGIGAAGICGFFRDLFVNGRERGA